MKTKVVVIAVVVLALLGAVVAVGYVALRKSLLWRRTKVMP